MSIKVDLHNAKKFLDGTQFDGLLPRLVNAHDALENGTGIGNDFIGWVKLPDNVDTDELSRIKAAAAKINSDSEVLVVIGIGGSYLGARAVIELLKSPNYNLKAKSTPNIFFVGNNLSADYVNEIIELVGDRDFSVNVISKSGTTTEPAIAFRVFKSLLEKKYGRQGAAKRIYATTDAKRGALKELSLKEGYETFVIPDDVGGRYSVLTAVGLLPIAVAGIDVDAMLLGARNARNVFSARDYGNPVYLYAAARHLLYTQGRKIEILGCYEPAFRFMTEWWKQLYGESEGKDGQGIFPASVELTADLHSMGQYIQDGERTVFETIVSFDKCKSDLVIEADAENIDGLNYLEGKTLSYVNSRAAVATAMAHVDGNVPNISVSVSEIGEEDIGMLIYFFELACGISGYLSGINPFNQPGVENYKKNMFALLGKPGYEDAKCVLEKRLQNIT